MEEITLKLKNDISESISSLTKSGDWYIQLEKKNMDNVKIKYLTCDDENVAVKADLKKKFEDVSNTSIEHSLKISKAHSSMVERINEIRLLKKNQKNIVKEEDFNKLVFRFNTFSDIENIDRLNKYLIPKLEKFSAKCDDLIESNI